MMGIWDLFGKSNKFRGAKCICMESRPNASKGDSGKGEEV